MLKARIFSFLLMLDLFGRLLILENRRNRLVVLLSLPLSVIVFPYALQCNANAMNYKLAKYC